MLQKYWATLKSDWRCKSLFELTQDLFLTQHVKNNTRNDAVLYLIFISEPGMNFYVREEFGEGFEKYSDHIIIIFDMILRAEIKTVQKYTYNYSNADVIGMKSYMKRINWNKELQNKNIKEMWCTLSSILNKCRNKYVPKKTGRREKNNVDGQCSI